MAKATRQLDAIHPNTHQIGAQPEVSGRRVLYGIVIALVAVAIVAIKVSQAAKTHLAVSVKTPVQVGQVITAANLGEAALPNTATVPYLPASQAGQVIGQVAQAPLYPGDILDPHQVGTSQGLPAGSVAKTLALAPEQAVGGSLHPGNTVAVFAAPSTSAPGVAPVAVEILAGVPVRSVSTQAQTGGTSTQYVTLQLTVAQATALDAVYRADKIDLALVGG